MLNTETFINEQNDRARQMREEMNHLIEYFTVLKKAGQIIFGEDEINNQPIRRLGLGISQADDPEDRLLRERRAAGSESENSDDYLFGNDDSKYSHEFGLYR